MQHAHPSLDRPAAAVACGLEPGRSTTREVQVTAPAVIATAVDPICGMKVAAVPATPHLQLEGETVWFCGEGCRAGYERRLTPG